MEANPVFWRKLIMLKYSKYTTRAVFFSRNVFANILISCTECRRTGEKNLDTSLVIVHAKHKFNHGQKIPRPRIFFSTTFISREVKSAFSRFFFIKIEMTVELIMLWAFLKVGIHF